MSDLSKPGAKLIIRHSETRFACKSGCVTNRFERAGEMKIEDKLPDNDADGELHGDQLLMAERVIASRFGGAIRISNVLGRIIVRNNLERPLLPFAQMAAPISPERAEPSGLNAFFLPFRRRVNSSNKPKPVRPVWLPLRPQMEFNEGDCEHEENVEP